MDILYLEKRTEQISHELLPSLQVYERLAKYETRYRYSSKRNYKVDETVVTDLVEGQCGRDCEVNRDMARVFEVRGLDTELCRGDERVGHLVRGKEADVMTQAPQADVEVV